MSATISEKISSWGYHLSWRVLPLLPHSVSRFLFRTGADLAWWHGVKNRQGSGLQQLKINLGRVLGSSPEEVPDELLRRSLRSYARYWQEIFSLSASQNNKLYKDLDSRVEGKEHVSAAVAQGRGVIIALPHMGNWDLAGVWLTTQHGQFTTVAERIKPESLYKKFKNHRQSLGFEILPLTPDHSEGAPYPRMVERLREGKIVCLMADRGMGRATVPVNFFGQTAHFPLGPAKLAVETGAVLFTAYTGYAQGYPEEEWFTHISEPLDTSGGVESITASIASQFEKAITEHPQDWHMLQPFWDIDIKRNK